MSTVSLIAAMDEAFGIGKDGQLLCHLPGDLQQFKAITLGKPVIMGRKTYESIGRLLPRRRNIILSRHAYEVPGAEVVSSLETALDTARDVDEIMIIGGSAVYAEAISFAQRLYLTRIEHVFASDVFFPTVDWNAWQLSQSTPHPADSDNQYAWRFERYERISFA
jgi:dihydrofolate reductase